jgi:hypothetical protein
MKKKREEMLQVKMKWSQKRRGRICWFRKERSVCDDPKFVA